MDPISLIVIELFVLVSIFILLLLYVATINAGLEKKQYKENIDTIKEDFIINNTGDGNFSDVKRGLDLLYLKDISRKEVNILLLEEINNIMDLKKKISTEKNITEYSEKLGVRKRLVEDWVRLGEFSRLYGISQYYITLLEKIDIKSVGDLINQDPDLLLNKLSQIEKNKGALPSIGMIRYWIRNAERIENQHEQANITHA